MRLAALAMIVAASAPQDPQLHAPLVDAAPVLDGAGDDACWAKARPIDVAVADTAEPDKGRKVVTVKAVRTGDAVHLLVTWPDETESASHKPWVWDREKGEYIEGDDHEDILAISFAMEGEFDPNMLAGIPAAWDVWHWKAARTNPAGFAMDRSHRYSADKPAVKAAPYTGSNGQRIWIARPEDEGSSATKKVPKPVSRGENVVVQHLAVEPTGSAADVRAKGAWKDGRWTVELSRKLDTGHKDDSAFAAGKPVRFAVAVFDATEEAHSASARLELSVGE